MAPASSPEPRPGVPWMPGQGLLPWIFFGVAIAALVWAALANQALDGPTLVSHNLAQDPNRVVRIVQFSDLHFRGKWPPGLTELIHQAQPDILVFTGDLISESGWLANLEGWFRQLPQVPRFAVLGNHERHSGEDLLEIEAFYRRCGFELLVGQSRELEVRGRRLRILGLDDALNGRLWPDLLWVARADVVLLHEPAAFGPLSRIWPHRPRLFLAGHTHGGQIRILGHPFLLPPGSRTGPESVEQFGQQYLVVSRGLGFSVFPLRLDAAPDIRLVLW